MLWPDKNTLHLDRAKAIRKLQHSNKEMSWQERISLNVWSAAGLQAKRWDEKTSLRKCIRPLAESLISPGHDELRCVFTL
jgi:hypothetical protein